ncbi:MAG TPA: HPr family phosphocarrier protein [Lacipirellulaceae bacterium]|jgi:phosphotransferase system HPr (HPr) family protein
MTTPPATRAVLLNHSNGLHARPAQLFARTAIKFESRIEVLCNNERVDGKSILHLLTMGAAQGTKLVIEADGPDAEQAVEALAKLVESDFADTQVADGKSQ